MNIIFIVFVIVVLIMAFLAFMHISYSIKQSKYVERKQDDQRKFNPIREKKWWK